MAGTVDVKGLDRESIQAFRLAISLFGERYGALTPGGKSLWGKMHDDLWARDATSDTGLREPRTGAFAAENFAPDPKNHVWRVDRQYLQELFDLATDPRFEDARLYLDDGGDLSRALVAIASALSNKRGHPRRKVTPEQAAIALAHEKAHQTIILRGALSPVERAAESLGVSPATLRRRVKEHKAKNSSE